MVDVNVDARSAVRLTVACVVSFSAALVGSLVMGRGGVADWYDNLSKPVFTPPNWVFGPAWTVLYVLMGVAAFLVWQKGWEIRPVRVALTWFAVQLALNALWSPVFFGLHRIGSALVVIILLWGAIVATIVSFLNVSKLAAVLLCPYLLWVSFAAMLNGAIWLLNR